MNEKYLLTGQIILLTQQRDHARVAAAEIRK